MLGGGEKGISPEENDAINRRIIARKYQPKLHSDTSEIMLPSGSVLFFGNYAGGKMTHFRYSPERPENMSVAQKTDPSRDFAPWTQGNITATDSDDRIAYAFHYKGEPNYEVVDNEVESALIEAEKGFDEAVRQAAVLRRTKDATPGGKGGRIR